MLFRTPRVIGLVLDLSLRSVAGRRIIETVRDEMISFVKNLEDDGFYVDQTNSKVSYTCGAQVAVLGNFETDGFRKDLGYSLRETLFVVSSEEDDFEKTVILISDRLSDSDLPALKKLFALNKKNDNSCQLVVIGLTTDCKKLTLDGVKFLHFDEITAFKDIYKTLFQEI